MGAGISERFLIKRVKPVHIPCGGSLGEIVGKTFDNILAWKARVTAAVGAFDIDIKEGHNFGLDGDGIRKAAVFPVLVFGISQCQGV